MGLSESKLRLWLGFILFAALLGGPAQVRPAAPTNLFYVAAGDVEGLVAAINAANDPVSHPRPDTIVLAGGVFTLTEADPLGGPDGPSGLPSITSKITVTGNGAVIERSGAASENFRIFHNAEAGSLILNDLTIRGGNSTVWPYGGGILNRGALFLDSSTISENIGTGISNVSGLTTLINSTVSGNVGGLGGGLFNLSSRTGIKLINSTVSGNSAAFGGGKYGSHIEMANTIIAQNTATVLGGDCSGGEVISLGHNIDSDGTCDLFALGDLPYVDPLLGPLQDNGGLTPTHAILSGSPAINAGDDSACPEDDQRGFPRPQGLVCDVGSFEADSSEYSLKLDQANIYPEGGGWNIIELGPVGQEFVPTMNALDVVELWTEDANLPSGVDLQVHIHSSTITGPIMGTSSTTTLPDDFKGVTRFDFPETVILAPGELYVLEVIVVSGDGWLVGWNSDSYPNGSAIDLGVPNGQADLWFREWVIVGSPVAVQIDIRPGTFPNRVNPADNRQIPVAVITTEEFDASTIDPVSVRFGPAGAPASDGLGQLIDVDNDNDLDLLLSFRMQETGIQCEDTSAPLTGATFEGQMIEGSDTILTVGC
jgi:hypothetical protein